MDEKVRALAEYFDSWYSDMAESPVKDEIQQRHYGLPPHLLSTSALPWDGIAVVTDALNLSPGDLLLDLACGRGGYGLEIASRTGARLLGLDISAEAVRQAADGAGGSPPETQFRVADLVDTGLDDDSVEAVLCIDSVQFAEPPALVVREVKRILVDDGRVVLTGWEPLELGDARLPELLRWLNLGAFLADAGFEDIHVTERTDWRAVERDMWTEASNLDVGGDPSLRSFHEEALRSLDTFDLVRRVMATATAAAEPRT